MTSEDPSTSPASCAACGAPPEANAVCLACAFESALSTFSTGCEGEPVAASSSLSGFGDFVAPAGGNFGKYRLIHELGSGGMGVIWEAEDTSLYRNVALKMIRGFAFSGAGDRQRFQREATAIAQLDHRNIVPIYEVGEIEGQPYFAMKRLVGGTLSARLTKSAMDQPEAAAVMEKLARAIAHAHGRGILHRDLKPDNVLFDESGEPHLTGFGLAKMLDEGDGLTLTTAHVGTPHYMSPEQARGRPADITIASDVWGAGALLFHMLTGRTPFTGDCSAEILHHVASDEPQSMDRAAPAMDKDLRTLTLRCLAKDPSQRLPCAEVLADELARWLDGHPIKTKPVPLATRAWHWIRRRPVPSAALAVGLLVIAIAAAAFFLKSKEERVLADGDTISLHKVANGESPLLVGKYVAEKMKKLPSEANSGKGNRPGEGRLGESREPMDKNRIEGRRGASRWHNTPKTSGMPPEVNAAAVRWSNVQLPGEIRPGQSGRKSAEAIVAWGTSRGLEDARINNETGGLNQ